MTEPKPIAADVPGPPPITPEDRARILREAQEWRDSVSEQFDAIERITPEDLRTVIR